MQKVLFQTLEDRKNPNEIEKNGPFACNWDNTWLGTGYYFWDTFIENAHWWASTRRYESYVICKGSFEYNLDSCFDLAGTTEHLVDFERSYELICNQLQTNKISVARVLAFMKETDNFKYQATRAWGMLSKDKVKNKFKVKFEFKKFSRQYLDTKPAIQLAIYDLKSVQFKNFEIVYPTHYISGYLV